MPSPLYLQIIIDIAFFVVILLLLHRLSRRMTRKPGDDEATVAELKRLMTVSQGSTDLFLRSVQESEERLNKLARQLDNREKRIIILIEKAESLIQQMASEQAKAESVDSGGEKYERILRMVQQGLSREEVSKRLGVTMGEIDLVSELEKAREAVHQQDLAGRGESLPGNPQGDTR